DAEGVPYSVCHWSRMGHLLAYHEVAILAAQVLDQEPLTRAADARVAPRDGVVRDRNIDDARSSEYQLVAAEHPLARPTAAGQGSQDQHEFLSRHRVQDELALPADGGVGRDSCPT